LRRRANGSSSRRRYISSVPMRIPCSPRCSRHSSGKAGPWGLLVQRFHSAFLEDACWRKFAKAAFLRVTELHEGSMNFSHVHTHRIAQPQTKIHESNTRPATGNYGELIRTHVLVQLSDCRKVSGVAESNINSRARRFWTSSCSVRNGSVRKM
jgi:hypothetical protein